MTSMPGVGLGVIILDKTGKVLMILRNSDNALAKSDMHLQGEWTLPAGKVKYGETLFEAAKRKVKSEVNLDVNNLKVISIADDINEHAHFLTIGLVTNDYKGEIKIDNVEHVDYAFYKLDEIPENTCFPTKKIIKNYINNKIYKGSDDNE